MRNKAKNFPERMSLGGEPRAKSEYASRRANGTINTNPQERMHKSNQSRMDK